MTTLSADPIFLRFTDPEGGGQASKAFAWSSATSVVQQVAQLASSVVLARLLMPSAYGLIAIIGSVMIFGAMFTDLGLGLAIVHRETPTRSFLSTVFWINAVTGVALTLVSGGLGYALAAIYGKPQLRDLMWIGGLTFALDLRIVHTSVISRAMRFRQLTILETISTLTGIAVSITAAAMGAGATSLVLGPVATTTCATLLLWLAVPWRPDFSFSRSDAVAMIRYCRGLVGFNIVTYWSRNTDNLLLGRFSSAAQLGLYSRAYALMMAPITQITTVFGRVLFPVLARARDRPRDVGLLWLRATKLVIVAVAPLALAFATAAPALISTLYGPRWHGAALLLELLATAGLAQLLPVAAGQVYYAFGATDELFRRGIVSSSLTVAAIVAGLPWGTTGVAVGVLARSCLFFWYPLVGLCRLTEMPMRYLLASTRGVTLACFAFAGASLPVRLMLSHQVPDPVLLIAQALAGTVAMQLALAVLDPALFSDFWRRINAGLQRLTRRGPGDIPSKTDPVTPTVS